MLNYSNNQNNGGTVLVTLLLDAGSQGYFQRLRDQHFPRDRNIVPAHVTLFHKLPEIHVEKIKADIRAVTQGLSFEVKVASIASTGNGVIYKLESNELCDLHNQLRGEWHQWLTQQDNQGFRPHVVVQNKVSAEIAKRTFDVLQRSFRPLSGRAAAVVLWRYLGGPWQQLEEFEFGSSHRADI